MLWYVKLAIYGVVVDTTYHPTRNAALTFIMRSSAARNPSHTQFFMGVDGCRGEEVPFSRPTRSDWSHGKCTTCRKTTQIHDGWGECAECIFDASKSPNS